MVCMYAVTSDNQILQFGKNNSVCYCISHTYRKNVNDVILDGMPVQKRPSERNKHIGYKQISRLINPKTVLTSLMILKTKEWCDLLQLRILSWNQRAYICKPYSVTTFEHYGFFIISKTESKWQNKVLEHCHFML